VTLRDRAEAALRSWNSYEVGRGAPPVVDFDCYPEGAGEVQAATSRVAVRGELAALQSEARSSGAAEIDERLGASVAYLDALLGARLPLNEYVQATQGCGARGWSDEYLESVRAVAVGELERLGVPWNAETGTALKAVEGPIADADAAGVIQQYARDMEDDVRRLAGTDAPFTVTVEHVDLDAYWAYWLDGAGSEVRLRINARNASFTEVQARQFALHELLGHGLQCASYAQQCRQNDVPWIRMTSVHAQQQVLLEGLAQALPLFVRPTDQLLVARVRLAHYTELAKAKVYLAINNGAGVPACLDLAHRLVPFWSAAAIGDMLTDRSVDPLLRSYLWAYPAGIDWFVRLADAATPDTGAHVVRESYCAPLVPDALSQLWLGGPGFGGIG
jgi:hypothetical protein